MASSVVITVNSLPANGTQLVIDDSELSLMTEVFVANRTQSGEIPTDRPGINDMVFAIWRAFDLDYNVFSNYRITYNLTNSQVTILSKNDLTQFTEVGNTTAGAITISVINDTPVPVFSIDALTSATATIGDPNTTVELTATTSEQAENISSPISQVVTSNPFVFETLRANTITLTMTKGSISDTYVVKVPLLLTAFFSITQKTTPSGSLIIVNRLSHMKKASNLLLTLEYSLDNVIWQTANSWSGLAEGGHTVYIKDNLGSSISIGITVDAFSPNLVDYDPVSEISNANALRFKENEIWDTNGISKTIENTLSHEENSKLNLRSFLQPFQKNDVINGQIKTNYGTVTAKIVDVDKNEESLTVVKSTENMNIKDVRDGKIKLLQDGTLAVYFGSGNTYDPDTLIQNGTYNIYEYLMDWVNVGDYVNVEGIGWGRIDRIDPPRSSFNYYYISLSIENTLNYTENQIVKITTVYNLVDFDRYEFAIDLSSKEGAYYIVVNTTDSEFEDKEFVSEWIDVKDEHENHHLINYYSTKNNEINYGTGISFSIRVPYLINLKWTPSSEQEIYVTDTKTINIDSKVREFYKLNLMPLPTAMAQKIVLILAHNRIFIDGVSYLLEGSAESKEIGVSNLYQISANLVKTNYVFDAKRGETASEILIGSGIPLSIDSGARGLLFIE